MKEGLEIDDSIQILQAKLLHISQEQVHILLKDKLQSDLLYMIRLLQKKVFKYHRIINRELPYMFQDQLMELLHIYIVD